MPRIALATPQKKQQFDPLQEYANDSTTDEADDEESCNVKQEKSDEDNLNHDISESSALTTERVFVKSIAYKEKQSKRARLDTFEVPLDEYTEELYEFGKFVAEQLMCLDVEEARVAQAEIRALLSKFDANKKLRCTAAPSTSKVQPLRCTAGPSMSQVQTLRCTAGPGTSNLQPTTDNPHTVMTQAVTQWDPAEFPITQSGSEMKTARPLLTGPIISRVYSTSPQVKQLVLMPMDTDTSVTQSGVQLNTPDPSGPNSGRTLAPAKTKFSVLNVDTSASPTAPTHYVLVPKTTGSRFNLTTQLGNTEETYKSTSVTQTISETSVGPTATQVGSSLVISAGPDLEPEPGSLSMIYDETLVKIEPESESLHSHVNVMLPNLPNNQGLLEIKHEADSEDET